MQILVLSDTHGKVDAISQLLNSYKHKVQTVIHLGDCASDILPLQPLYPEINIVAVAGNCDYLATLQQERILTLDSKRILLVHGHNHNIKSNYNRLMYYAQEKEVDACLFGHTHVPAIFESGSVFFMNPGSLGAPIMRSPSHGLLTIDSTGNITGEVIEE